MEKNGEVVNGDLEYDGRVILYVLKGEFVAALTTSFLR
jgi:hypothetical protein